MGADMSVHDPYVDRWFELETPETYPAIGLSLARFFRNQQDLSHVRVQKDLPAAFRGIEAVVLAVRHAPYLNLDPEEIVAWAGGPIAVVDCFGILDDARIRRLFDLGCEVKGLGRGRHPADQGGVAPGPAGAGVRGLTPRKAEELHPRRVAPGASCARPLQVVQYFRVKIS